MLLTNEQKDLIFYVLAGFQKGLYWDEDFDEIECNTNCVDFQMDDMLGTLLDLCPSNDSRILNMLQTLIK